MHPTAPASQPPPATHSARSRRCAWLLAATLPLAGAGCSSTGDPSEGGLLGWSASVHDQRITEKRALLDSMEHDTAQQRASAANRETMLYQLQTQISTLQQQEAKLRAELERYQRKEVDLEDKPGGRPKAAPQPPPSLPRVDA